MKPRAYGPFPYSPIIRRPKLTWPNGARVALWVIPNIEYFSLEERPGGYGGTGKIPDVVMWSERDYGNRVGVWRLMEVLDRYGIRGSVALNSLLCDHHPVIIEEGNKRKWEWMGHNESNTRRLNEAPLGEEAQIIKRTLATIERAAGTRPKGWLSSGLQETWESLDLLAAEGCQYVCDWCNDDQPYIMHLDGGRRLVSVPYPQQTNDKPAYERMYVSPGEFRDMICRTFDVLYREGADSGRVLPIALHPYISGVPHRIGALDAAFEYICRHEGVWHATGAEIAEFYLSPAAAAHRGEM
ncbi:MAG TPA: polysaccharide deacetylase family protein [Xanthobacteraceae bacterium]|jgi:allantoinase|nr:polysaccharide deacetylase family protein [Xanthobacteraceae bacterium]